jgi:ribosomal protein S18 acetylase RimI-like enzyme
MAEKPKNKGTGDLKIELKDGRVIKTRTVRNSDTELFLNFFDGLSARSRSFMHGWSTLCDRKHAESITAQADSDNYYSLVILTSGPAKERVIGYSWIQGLKGSGIPLLGIGIIDEYQNVGLGRILLRLMIERAKHLNLDRVKLGVFDDNPRAIHIYESVGFQIDPAGHTAASNRRTKRDIYDA